MSNEIKIFKISFKVKFSMFDYIKSVLNISFNNFKYVAFFS